MQSSCFQKQIARPRVPSFGSVVWDKIFIVEFKKKIENINEIRNGVVGGFFIRKII